MGKEQLFTEQELARIYALADEYGGEDKTELVRELKSLLLYERLKIKNKILNYLKEWL